MVTLTLAGLVLGAMYALVALGYNIVLLASGAFNFAHGAIVLLGTFVAYEVGVAQDQPLLLVLLAAAVIGGAIGFVLEYVAIRPVIGRGSHGELVTTIGASTLIVGIVTLIWGEDVRAVRPVMSSDLITVLGGRVSIDGLILIALAILATLGLWMWSRHTLSGTVCRAASEDGQVAVLRGINPGRLSLYAMIAAGAMGAMSGQFIATQTLAVLSVATVLTVKSFLALTLGGFGSFPGALIGGLAVGFIEAIGSRYIGGAYSLLLLFFVLLMLLLVRPEGLFGRRAERVV
jgi:branched-chain amino acid transport system permease protein